MDVIATTLPDLDRDVPAHEVTGELVETYVLPLLYTKRMVDGLHVDPLSVVDVASAQKQHVMVIEGIEFPTRVKYSEDQPRDDHGRFGEGSGDAQVADVGHIADAIGSTLSDNEKRVLDDYAKGWESRDVAARTALGNPDYQQELQAQLAGRFPGGTVTLYRSTNDVVGEFSNGTVDPKVAANFDSGLSGVGGTYVTVEVDVKDVVAVGMVSEGELIYKEGIGKELESFW